ncbi:hypothetical protein H477_0309 [[Clostridium] sordellii ATCC 9714]|uniref:Lipoprotein n=1 Tax=Paraclostridium sordellii TaxID=1505 RepID=A0ABP1Y181_PARSO|nr:hypothetical protein [Paeniclostridium sordellii]EPZ61197.1 hypothetical protein H477_0309 [[Clostridium] sordellii ATCC 9714] [Paeniclostridium sordellii ATCC 9714]TAN66883.1 hypothetical protein WS9_009280 [Paeniclostridium sordellii 8483]CEJ75495.1 hypothetical protein ATCC9714PCS11_00361 (plasmid) [[Clostridium] sordellii] [Paeniclostridium sordellii]CEN22452.1 Uncharacterised protein [[Clostridium] sordellii] [Paeniclostridium sordellii]CEN29743.1 Uncharacterised protein [[Clostridium]
MYKKISILLFIITILLGGKLFIVSKELKDTKNELKRQSVKKEETIKDENTNTETNKIENTKSESNKNDEIEVNDITNPIEGLSRKDNKDVRNTVITFVKAFANYCDKDDNVEKRIQTRIYNVKDLLSEELYKSTRAGVESEAMHQGKEFTYRKLEGMRIYEAYQEGDKVHINLETFSTYYDIFMKPQSIHKSNRYSTSDFKFTLVKSNDKWIIQDFTETFK